MDRILIVDDDSALCALLAERLSSEGFETEAVGNGILGLDRAMSSEHDLVVLDLMLPRMSGLDVLRCLRAQSHVPVLVLTARGEDVDRIVGLEIGADDYLPKPFNSRELIARIRAILRRSTHEENNRRIVVVGNIRLDLSAREVWVGRARLDLTGVEFALMESLMRAAGQVVTREDLTKAVLGRQLGPLDRVIDVHVSNLRKKMSRLRVGERIKAVRGSGYILTLPSVSE